MMTMVVVVGCYRFVTLATCQQLRQAAVESLLGLTGTLQMQVPEHWLAKKVWIPPVRRKPLLLMTTPLRA